MTDSTPSYPALPFDNFVSQFNAVDPKHGMFSNLSTLLNFDSFGHQLSPAFFTDVYMVNQSDDGPYRPPVGISPHILSGPFQGPPPPYSADPRLHCTSHTKWRGSCQGKKHLPSLRPLVCAEEQPPSAHPSLQTTHRDLKRQRMSQNVDKVFFSLSHPHQN
ncbi:hypothetical protein H4582DRAFT_2150266 [Lactarius indigo]|nr:hypothetical protein H4582DRAFT_2150266 [Lactarius indigo]